MPPLAQDALKVVVQQGLEARTAAAQGDQRHADHVKKTLQGWQQSAPDDMKLKKKYRD